MIPSFCASHGIALECNVPLSTLTTFRIGGAADYVALPATTQQTAALISFLEKESIRYFVMGRGSDILASDAGFRGVILLTREMNSLSCDGNTIVAGAGCSMASVSNLALKHSLAGLEFLHGIPGSIGGGVFMNAGAYGSEMSAYLTSVEWVDGDGTIHVTPASELNFSYRHSYFTDHFGVVCSATFSCERGDADAIRAVMNDLDSRRRDKQPLEYPSAGSAFKRPEGHFAGKLIEDCGLKGYTFGNAAVSEKHAGFIINLGGATSADVHGVIDHVTETVRNAFGVTLEPEIRFLQE
ncbi:MAG: UDP-N-acetylmuramate dehydrogenase [Clostridia bacterium]|nr:UDP-N-acetylmuramate dehydrogenase [Clostridia bacterium]